MLDARKLTDALVKLEKACDSLPQIAETATSESQGMLFVAAQGNIYSTVPGARKRTGEYLRSLSAKGKATKNAAAITVKSDSPYALYIEFGRPGVPVAQLQALALAGAINDPLTLGRSGQQWWVAGPVLISGQAYAAKRLQDLFAKEVRKVVNGG